LGKNQIYLNYNHLPAKAVQNPTNWGRVGLATTPVPDILFLDNFHSKSGLSFNNLPHPLVYPGLNNGLGGLKLKNNTNTYLPNLPTDLLTLLDVEFLNFITITTLFRRNLLTYYSGL